MITRLILICDRTISILFVLESTFSCVSVKFSLRLYLDYKFLDTYIYIYLYNSWGFLYVFINFITCLKMIMGYETLVDLVSLNMEVFDIICGIS